MLVQGSLRGNNSIIEGCLNMIMNMGEISRQDTFTNYFTHVFKDLSLVDLELV
jgi:hypothetical protein